MKAKYVITTAFIVFLALSGCREINVNTKINKDGSFLRTLSIRGDSANVIKMGLPYPVNDSWKKQLSKDTLEEGKYLMVWQKMFDNDEVLMREINQDTSWMKNLQRSVSIEKRFGFFYSYISYKEEIKDANPFNFLDHKDFLTKNDMEWIQGKRLPVNHADSLELEKVNKKAELYLFNSFSAEMMSLIKTAIKKLNNNELKVALVDKYQDSLNAAFEKWSIDSSIEFIDKLYELSGNMNLLDLKNDQAFQEMDTRIDFFEQLFTSEQYRNTVELPGLITATNSNQLKGNTVAWDVQSLNYFYDDFEMYAESRVVNNWAFILSGIILLTLVIMVLVKLFKK